MFDAVDVSQIPADAVAVAGYTGGRWPTYSQLLAQFPHACVLSIAISAAGDAECLDIETGDAVPGDAAAWYGRQRARGVTRPCLYASASLMESAVIPAVNAAGIERAAVRLWSAHYTGSAHICGPSSCGLTSIGMDGTQFTDQALGRDLDESLLLPGFFSTSPPPPPVPAWEVAMMAALPTLAVGSDDASLPHWYVRSVQAIANVIYQVSPALAEDGVFGPATKTGVEQIQRQAGITADGICGPVTWSVLVTGSAP
jgi:peptidoglycan hydrolase-like protein with peptidoglycan-binding domain